MQVFVLNSR